MLVGRAVPDQAPGSPLQVLKEQGVGPTLWKPQTGGCTSRGEAATFESLGLIGPLSCGGQRKKRAGMEESRHSSSSGSSPWKEAHMECPSRGITQVVRSPLQSGQVLGTVWEQVVRKVKGWSSQGWLRDVVGGKAVWHPPSLLWAVVMGWGDLEGAGSPVLYFQEGPCSVVVAALGLPDNSAARRPRGICGVEK